MFSKHVQHECKISSVCVFLIIFSSKKFFSLSQKIRNKTIIISPFFIYNTIEGAKSTGIIDAFRRSNLKFL